MPGTIRLNHVLKATPVSAAQGRLAAEVRVPLPKMYAHSVRYLPALLLVLGTCTFAQSGIHRCTQDDGTVAFQQMPCEEETNSVVTDAAGTEHDERNNVDPPDSGDDAFDFSSPFDEPADPPAAPQPDRPAPISKDRATCEKSARDAIDAIDLELRKGFAPEKRQQHLDELLKLTQQLRECKQL